MNPYEKTSLEMKRQSEGPKRFAKTAAGLGAASFAPVLARAAPFLSDYITPEMAVKGLSKINPKLGKFVNDAFNGGYEFDEVKDFLKEAISGSEGEEPKQGSEKEPAKQSQNIVEQYSPDLHQFILGEIQKGRSPQDAAGRAIFDDSVKGKFQSIIKKIEKDHKAPWSQIVESIYGGGQAGQSQQPQAPQQMQEPQGQTQGQTSQGLDPGVAQILQQGAALLQKFKGQP